MRRAAPLALALWLAAPAAAGAGEELPVVEERLRETREQAHEIDDRVGGVLEEIERLDREIERRGDEAARLAGRAADAGRREAEARERVAALDRRLAALRERLLERAGALLRLSQRGLGPVLFRGLGETADARRHQVALRAVLDHDRALLAEARATRREAETAREAAARAATDLAAKRTAAERERERLQAVRAEKETVVASLRGEAEKSERLIGELESAAGKLRRLLDRERAETAAREAPPAPPLAALGSGFRPPVDDVSRGVLRSRNGVEIPAEAGAEIHAVAAGRVVFADWFPGYGKMVIVDHGGHLHSVYAYAEDVLVERGRVVRAGEVVARIGSTGLAATARLYFEMREKGVPRPPDRYIPVLATRAAGAN